MRATQNGQMMAPSPTNETRTSQTQKLTQIRLPNQGKQLRGNSVDVALLDGASAPNTTDTILDNIKKNTQLKSINKIQEPLSIKSKRDLSVKAS